MQMQSDEGGHAVVEKEEKRFMLLSKQPLNYKEVGWLVLSK